MKSHFALALLAGGLLATVSLPSRAAELVIPENMAVLHARMPDKTYRFLGTNAPGQIFYPGETANVRLALTKGTDTGTVRDFALEIQEITTRSAEGRVQADAFFGSVPLIGLEGKPISVPMSVSFDAAKPETEVELKNVPIPAKFGTYALVLTRGAGAAATRQFLGTVCRVPLRRPYGTMDNVPTATDGVFFDNPAIANQRAAQIGRVGFRGWRTEGAWFEKEDGTYDWSTLDPIFNAAKANGMQVMMTLSGHQPWEMPFKEPIPAIGWTPQTGGYSGTGDWVTAPENYPRYGKWIRAFAERYKDTLWGVENYNEPWEAGGISGWARDLNQYRALQKLIATNVRAANPKIKIVGTSSIMNTEDKFYSGGDREYDQYIDSWSDHYVSPPMCYGPLVAAAHGKESLETETWFVNSEYQLPQISQFLASGQKRLTPYHPQSLFDAVPGVDDRYHTPTPVVAASAAFNYFVTGKRFEKMPFLNHLPFVFQFGHDDDKTALLVMFGRLMPLLGGDPKDDLWSQVNNAKGGTITIDNRDGLLQFFDLAGNPAHVKEKSVTFPLGIFPTYIQCAKGPRAAVERIRAARIDGQHPVEILPHDFSAVPGAGVTLSVTLHNALNRPITGNLAVKSASVTFAQATQPVSLAAGQSKSFSFPVQNVTAPADAGSGNTYPVSYSFTSDAGNADYAEDMNAAIAPKRTMTIDGNMDKWKDIPGVTAIGTQDKIDLGELARRPWVSQTQANPKATVAEVKLAWDDNFLYIAGRVQDPTDDYKTGIRNAGKDDNQYFHNAADDTVEPYKSFIERKRTELKDPKLSFAQVPYVWKKSPWPDYAWNRDRLQFAFDTTPGWHDMKGDSDRVPYGFHVVPDSDYEYSLYLTNDGGGELWRLLAPGVPRVHDVPRQPHAPKFTGTVLGAKEVVKRDGNTYIYEAAIPRAELGELKFQAGSQFGFTWMAGNESGPSAYYGENKAVTKTNGLTLHPYFSRKPSAGVRWTLVN